MRKRKFAVVGAGHGGKSMAAHLVVKGFQVNLFNRSEENLVEIREAGGIYLEQPGDESPAFAKLNLVTTRYKEGIQGVDIIMVVVPAFAHAVIARRIAPYLVDGQIIILNPGRTLGALEFRNTLEKYNCTADVMVAETQTFIYASRDMGGNHARIFREKESTGLAAFPSSDTGKVLDAVRPAYPQFFDAGTILDTGLNNIGGVFHPTISLLNTGWIESEDEFEFYSHGVSRTVARMVTAVDRERTSLAAVMGVRPVSALDWLKNSYHAKGDNLFDAIQNLDSYQGILAPGTLDHRYIHEDIPMSLVPIASIGRQFGKPMRTIESIIQLAIVANKTDYWLQGRTLENLGLNYLSRNELIEKIIGERAEVPARIFSEFPVNKENLPEKIWDPNIKPDNIHGSQFGNPLPN